MFQTNKYYSDTNPLSALGLESSVLLLLLFVAALFVGRAVLAFVRRGTLSRRPKHAYGPRKIKFGDYPSRTLLDQSPPAIRPDTATPNLADPKQQMDAIARVGFETVPLLNKQEARLLPILESATREFGAGHRLMAQVSLGEVIRPRATSPITGATQAAHASINSKRLDFALIDRRGHLVAAIEYQGSGHHQNNAFLRDAVKREALRKAGVPYVEVEQDFDRDELRNRLQRLMQPKPRMT